MPVVNLLVGDSLNRPQSANPNFRSMHLMTDYDFQPIKTPTRAKIKSSKVKSVNAFQNISHIRRSKVPIFVPHNVAPDLTIQGGTNIINERAVLFSSKLRNKTP